MASTQTETTVDLQPQIINLCFTRENAFPFTLTLNDQNGTPIDITGSSAILTVSSSEAGGIANQIFQLTGVITSPLLGQIIFTPTSVQMDIEGEFSYDVLWTNAASDQRTPIRGTFTVGPRISDPNP